MGEAIGARSIDLEWVQACSLGRALARALVVRRLCPHSRYASNASTLEVHPTGLVEPDDPEAKIKLPGPNGHG